MSEMELFRSSTPPIPEESGSALMSPSKSPKARVSLATASTKLSSVRSLPSTPVPPDNNSGRSSFSKTTMSITEQIARKARKSTVLDEKNALLILAIPDYDEYKILKPYSCRSLTNTSQFVGGHDFVTRHNPQEVNDFKKQYSRDVGNLNRQRSVVAPPGSALMAAGFAASTSSSLSLDSTPSSPTSPPGNNRNNQVREVWKKVFTATQKHYWVLTDFGVASLIGPEYRMTTRLPVVPPQPPSASSPPTTPYPCRSPAPRPNTALVAFSARESVRIGSRVDLDDEKTLTEISRTEMYSPNSRPLSPPRSPWHAMRPTLGYASPSKPDIPLYVDLVQSSSSLSSPRAKLRTPASAVLKLEDCSLTNSMASDSPTLQPFAMEIAPPAVALGQLHPGEVYLFPVRIRNVGFKQHRFRVKKVVATCAGFEAGLAEATYDKDTARLAPGLAAIVTIALSFRTPGRASGALHLELEGSGACEVAISAGVR